MADLPDKIWLWDDAMSYSFTQSAWATLPYLASTPARERADKLVEALRKYEIPKLIDELNGRIVSDVTGRELKPGKFHDASVAADKIRSLLAEIDAEKEPLP